MIATTSLITALRNALRVPDLRAKLLFTLGILVIFRFIAHVPIPGVDVASLQRFFQQSQFLGLLDLFSGGAMRNLSVAAMGVYPYITASIVMQLLTPLIPALEALSKEGEAGRTRLNIYTHWLTVPIAALQAYGQLLLLQGQGIVTGIGLGPGELGPTLAMVLSMTAGTVLLVWLGELITEYGIGNGVSIIIFSGIVSGLPAMVGQGLVGGFNVGSLIAFLALGLAIVFAIVLFTEAQRRVPVQYARTMMRGGRVFRQGGTTYIPLKVNMAGMIPLIFALSVLILPGILASPFTVSSVPWVRGTANAIVRLFDGTGLFYWIVYFVLVVAFTFLYTMIIFRQQNLAENLQKSGGFIPGIRPGRATAEYLDGVITRITWAGAIFLGVVAIMPYIGQLITGYQALQLSSTGLLIVVGVALDTMKQLEAQLLMRQYEGFIR
jgi:preprotein translocase subunit SecY